MRETREAGPRIMSKNNPSEATSFANDVAKGDILNKVSKLPLYSPIQFVSAAWSIVAKVVVIRKA